MRNRHVNTIILGCGLIFALTTCVLADGAATRIAIDSVQVQARQQQMLSNPEIMTIILSLQNDPDMQALLNDPTIMAEIQAGKLDTFVHDPRLLRLLSKPQMKDVEKRLR